MSIKTLSFHLCKSLPPGTITRSHAHEFIAAALGFKSYAGASQFLILDSQLATEVDRETLTERVVQLKPESAQLIIPSLLALLQRMPLTAAPLREIIQSLEQGNLDNIAIIEAALSIAAKKGNHWAHYGIALIATEALLDEQPSDYWYQKRNAGAVLTEQEALFADEFQKYQDAKNKCLAHLEEAFAQGNLHAGIKLNEIFGDNRIFEAQVNTEKLDRTLSWDPLDIARKAAEGGFEEQAPRWYAIGCETGDIEAVRELTSLVAQTNPRLAWTLVEFGRLLGTDITVSEAFAIDEYGNDYDDEVGGPAYADEIPGVDAIPVSNQDYALAKSVASEWFMQLTNTGKATIDLGKMG